VTRLRNAALDVGVCGTAAGLVIAGTVGTWMRAGSGRAAHSVTGIHVEVGVMVLMSVTFGAALLAWRAVKSDGWSGPDGAAWAIWGTVFAAAGLGACVYALVSPGDAEGARAADVRWGLYLSLAAAIALVLETGWLLWRRVLSRARATVEAPATLRLPTLESMGGIGVLYVVAIAPVIFSGYTVNSILTYTLWAGIAAAGLVFLSSSGGMVSLAQVPLYGIAGFTLGNIVSTGGSGGLNLGWDPWLGVVLALAIATAIGLLFGALASRSTGIYFLMITLTYAVIANLFFGQVADLSGFNGITSIQQHVPSVVGSPDTHPNRLYYVALMASVVMYALLKYIVRTPFGLALQGIRDDPVRMASLGYNVPLHRTLAFGLAAFVAAVAGVLNVWWVGDIAPDSINLTQVLALLIVAVIGGLYRLEGAWLGAFAYVMINNYTHTLTVPGIGGSFNTVIGLIFLAIVLVSPGGLFGIWDWVVQGGPRQTQLRARRVLGAPEAAVAAETGGTDAVAGH
jgi:branched-chain amino acid transport system permease protein